MRNLFILFFIIFISCNNKQEDNSPKEIPQLENNLIQEGDIIFHTSKSSQSIAIQQVTQSKYSHMGIIFKDDDQFYVYEAIEPVSKTPLINWINRGVEKHFIIKRLKTGISNEEIAKMKSLAISDMGKHYDLTFEWSDEKIYCSEYVWKIYKEALHIEVGTLQQLKDFDLTIPSVQQKIKERYGNHIPLEEIVISPESIFQSKELMTIQNPRIR